MITDYLAFSKSLASLLVFVFFRSLPQDSVTKFLTAPALTIFSYSCATPALLRLANQAGFD